MSQILNGDFDHKLSKLVELALACDMVPRIELMPKAYAEQVVENTYLQPKDWTQSSVYFRTIPSVKPEAKAPASAQSVKVLPVVGKSSVRIGSCDWGVAENRKSTNKIA